MKTFETMIREGKLSAVRNTTTSNNFPNKGMGFNLEETDQACHEITTPMASHISNRFSIQTLWSTYSGMSCTTHGPKHSVMPRKLNKSQSVFFYRHCGWTYSQKMQMKFEHRLVDTTDQQRNIIRCPAGVTSTVRVWYKYSCLFYILEIPLCLYIQ